MQLTMEPLEEILEHARVMDEAGFDTIWLAEAYPWWRKHSMEARSSTALSPLVARETERLAVGWGIISPYTRHPMQIAMEARVTQEAAGPGRFYLGLGVSKIFMRHAGIGDGAKPVAAMTRGGGRSSAACSAGEALDIEGKVFSAHVPALADDAETPRWDVPLYFAGTGPMMLKAAAQAADGLLTASITTPAFVRYVRERVAEAGRDPDSLDLGCTIVASIDEDRDRGRDGAREIAGMYLANKVQNIQARRRHAARVRRPDARRDRADRRGDGARRPAGREGRGHGRDPRQVQADRRHAGGLHRRDRGVPRRGLHARHARALGRGPRRPAPAVRRARAARTSAEPRPALPAVDGLRSFRSRDCPSDMARQDVSVILSPRR